MRYAGTSIGFFSAEQQFDGLETYFQSIEIYCCCRIEHSKTYASLGTVWFNVQAISLVICTVKPHYFELW